MPIVKIPFTPGINREVTNYAGSGGYYDCNKIRFRAGNPEKIGGWINAYTGNTFYGVARQIWNWETSNTLNLIAMGTNQKYYVNFGGAFYDITPVAGTSTLSNPFSTTSGSPLVTVNDSAAVTLGTWVTYSGATSVGGLTLNSSYEVIAIPNLNSTFTTASSGTGTTATISFTAQPFAPPIGSSVTISEMNPTGYNGTYTITASSTTSVSFANTTTGSQVTAGLISFALSGYQIIAGSNATSSTSGGGTVTATYQINASNATVASNGSGWGGPAWGEGGWGGVNSAGQLVTTYLPLRLWSQANFGDNLVAAISDGAMYYWTPTFTSGGFQPAVTINTAAASNIKTTQTVVSAVSSSYTFTVANSQGVDYGATVTLGTGAAVGSSIPANTTVSPSPTYTGYTTITVTNPVTLAAGDPVNFSYSGLTAPTIVNQVIVSTTNQFAIALGSTSYNPVTFNQLFNPMLVRWSDQSIPYEWTPATYNQSGEQVLSAGSYIVGGISTRQENLIWTDRALYSMQYVGAPFVFSFTLMMDNISIASPYAMITVNGVTFWMGVDKFYTYNGTVTVLPCTVRKYVFSNINQEQSYQIICGQNEQFNEVWWFYPSSGSYVNDSYVIYNYAENTWYYGTLNRTAWFNSSLQYNPLAVFSIQTSYLNTAITTTGSISSIQLINAYSYPESGTIIIDSEQMTYTNNTGTTLTGITRAVNNTVATTHAAYTKVSMTAPNQILFHEYGVDDYSTGTAQPIYSYIQTSDFDIGQGGDRFGYVWRMLPDFTFVGSNYNTAPNPVIYLTLNPRNNSGSSYLTSTGGDENNSVALTDGTTTNTQAAPTPPNQATPGVSPTAFPANTYPVEQFTGAIYTRVRGRQMAYVVSSTTTGVQWQMGQMRFDIRPDGRR